MPTELIRFSVFELDPRNYSLRRSGANVKLERIPLELLLLLAGRAGELVSREEIIEKLWGKGVYLDTESAINTAIRKIRLVLGDDPGQPRFVQTVTGRGYRFVASVAGPDLPAAYSSEETRFVSVGRPIGPISGQVKEDLSASGSFEPATLSSSTTVRADNHRISRFRLAAQQRTRWVLAALAVACLAFALLGLTFVRQNASLPRPTNYLQITDDGRPKQGPVLTDGLRLYFCEGTQNHRNVVQVSASGGETTVLANPLETPYVMDIAPNRSELLLGSISIGANNPASKETPAPATSNRVLWTLALPAGGARRTGGVVAGDATWSPDGRDIAYVRGNEVFRASNDGSAERKLASLPGIASWIRWSPDGSRLRLTLFDPSTDLSTLWELSSDGKLPHALLPGWNPSGSDCCGNWTPDSKYFLFQSTRDGKTEIWGMKDRPGLLARDAGRPVQLTAGPIESLAPVVSSNGRKLYVIGQKLRGELARYDSKEREFVPYLSGISAEFVNFSRDGEWITYVTFPERILWRSRLDGTDRLQLTAPPMQPTVPRWSPDGRRIAFFDAAPGKPWKIYLISADGGAPEPLLEEQRNEMDPSWSSDGNSVIFSYFPVFEHAAPDKLGIYMVDVGTRRTTKVPGSDGLWTPRWSPDGRYVVARSMDSLALLIFDFRTQIWTTLANGAYFGFVNWSSDGRYIYYVRRGKDPAILRMRISGRTVEEVASLKDVRQTGFRDAFWTGLSPDDSPLVLRDVGTEEIYALDLHAP